jgi:very-short-patch-repair endonuclease/predicted transcriptional regulator of viral defense system
MGQRKLQWSAVWELARRQHGVVARWQLLALGMNADAIQHRIERGRLHPIHRGVYAVGRPELTRHGRWMAAVLACGREAMLSHTCAAELWGVLEAVPGPIDVSIPEPRRVRRTGIRVHRRQHLAADASERDGIPVTDVVTTFIDLAADLVRGDLEEAINRADRLDLITPQALRASAECKAQRRGVGTLREVLDRRTFTLTDSQLEREFRPIAADAGLPSPLTQERLHGFRLDFYWPDLGLVVETDGLRYHRTPAQQARDRVRDQVLTAAGITCLRFTHGQIHFDREHVRATLTAVAARLRSSA